MNITSLQNPKIKQVIRLRNRRERDETGKFLIEGYREILRAVENHLPIEQLFFCPEFFLGVNENTLIDMVKQAEIFSCTKQVFEKISYRDRPDGLLAISPQNHLSLAQLQITDKPPLLIIAEAIEKPGNLGTILRCSDAVGADALIVCDACTDIYNPNVVRASVGTLFTVPVIEASSEETIAWLHKHQIHILAATPHTDLEYTSVDLRKPIAIVLGTEQYGLSDQWMSQANMKVRIPMLGTADSLNVAMAATILLFEALRQRRVSP